MLRNISGQKWRVYAWDTTTGQAKTGDAANISAYITKDFGTPAVTNDAAPTELSSTNQPGYYEFDLLAEETNAHTLSLAPKSGTTDIAVIPCPAVVNPIPQYLSLLGIASDGDLSGNLDGNVGGSVASVTGGINTSGGTITTLDALDTAQDTQHGTTQNAISNLNDPSASDVATAVEAAILDEGDATALLAAIAAKVEAFIIDDGDATATLQAIATAVWGNATRSLTDKAGFSISGTKTTLDDLNDFDPANDAVANVTLVDTTTTNTDMRGTDSAYTGTPPTAAQIRTEMDSNSTKLADIAEDTNELQTNQGNWVTATSVTVSDKTGFKLSSDGLDSIAVTRPSAKATTFPAMIVQLFYRFFGKTTLDESELKTYAADGTTVVTTQTVSDDNTTQTQGEAS